MTIAAYTKDNFLFVLKSLLNHDKEIKNATKLKDTFRCVLVCKIKSFMFLQYHFSQAIKY
jgi:poly(A) polymerase Pap1